MTRPIIAIDPGPTQSAWCIIEGDKIIACKEDNYAILIGLCTYNAIPNPPILAIEMIAAMGMSVGAEVFDTAHWTGRFAQAYGGKFIKVYRKQVKMHLCNSMRAKDGNIRQALIDRFGPGKEKAIGTKAKPGKLYGIKADMWAALAVAVTAMDTLAPAAEGGAE